MHMSKKVIRWGIYFLVMLLILPAVFGISAFMLPPQYDETYLGEFHEKKERLESIEEKKLVVVGGSSVAFGIYSDLMEEQLGMPIVNWGLYAPLGSRTMLEACFDEINEGDIVVFSPEQNQETLSLSFQAKDVWQAMDGEYSLLKIYNESELKQILGAFPEFAVSKIRYAFCGKLDIEGIYQRDSFNKVGDILTEKRKGNCMEGGYDPTHLIDFSFFPDEEFLDYLNDYAARIEKKGAVFYYRFCPMNEQAVLNSELLDEWFLKLDEATDFTILGDPHKSIMDSGWFYDTNFHLNGSGAVINTYYFVRDIKAELKDSTVTDIELPEMPDPLNEDTSGNNMDAEYFLYEEDGNNLVIAGVSNEGRKKEELTFPSEYNGRKITAVLAGSLEGCMTLQTVNVYGGITLYDGCFADCGNLRRIRLLGKPSEITAGRDLLQGCTALLYSEYADEYRLDYSWGIYSDKIREDDSGK